MRLQNEFIVLKKLRVIFLFTVYKKPANTRKFVNTRKRDFPLTSTNHRIQSAFCFRAYFRHFLSYLHAYFSTFPCINIRALIITVFQSTWTCICVCVHFPVNVFVVCPHERKTLCKTWLNWNPLLLAASYNLTLLLWYNVLKSDGILSTFYPLIGGRVEEGGIWTRKHRER